jgi:hypothetical protein
VVPGWPRWALPWPAPRRVEERRFLAGGLDVVGRGAQDWFHAGSHRAVSAMSSFVPGGLGFRLILFYSV